MLPLQLHDMPWAVHESLWHRIACWARATMDWRFGSIQRSSQCVLIPSSTSTRTLWAHSSVQTIYNRLCFAMLMHSKNFLRKLITLLQVFCLCIKLSQRFHVSCPVTTLLWLRTLPPSWLKLSNTTSDKPALIWHETATRSERKTYLLTMHRFFNTQRSRIDMK